jgi:hypothetical protein
MMKRRDVLFTRGVDGARSTAERTSFTVSADEPGATPLTYCKNGGEL